MAAVQGIVKAHGGAILVASAPSRGTTIRILFPVPATEALPDAAPATCPATSDGAPRTDKPVLVVDDEEAVRAPCMAALRHLGYHVLGAADGQEAVEVVRRRGASLACVLMDVTMPTLDGIAAAREIRRLAPGLRVILTSGYEQTGALEALGADQSVRFLQKPYRLEDLRVAVGAAVADAAVADSAVADAAVDSVDA
jgi:CheY-like chemotaxis protein